jgi:archaellum component FlaF (FlaF/FlaG flagellin family)
LAVNNISKQYNTARLHEHFHSSAINMKSSILLFSAICFTTYASSHNLVRNDAENSFECYNNETCDQTDYPPVQISLAAARLSQAATVQINAYSHITVSKETDMAKKYVEGKFDFLNKNLKLWGYHFNLPDFEVTVNATWAQDIATERAAKQ